MRKRRLTATQQAQLLLSMERLSQEIDIILSAADAMRGATNRIRAIIEAAAPWAIDSDPARASSPASPFRDGASGPR